MTVTRTQIVEEARTWLDVPWRHQGRDRNSVDCAGLLECVGKNLGLITYTGPKDYRRESQGLKFLRHFSLAGCRLKSTNQAKDGDILIFRIKVAVYPRHCGIMSTKYNVPHFIHSYGVPRWRKVVETELEGIWDDEFIVCYEYPNVED